MSSGTTTTAKASRKRKRGGDSLSEDSDNASKRRGRPRTDKADESAVDRRRTQIRMAQRAYRQRKETTLDDLRKRVSDLTTTMECMNKAFEDVRDRLVSTGLPESQLDELAELSVRFVGFMKCVRQPGEAPECKTADEILSVPSESLNRASQADELPLVPNGKNVPAWLDQSTLNLKERGTQQSDIGMGYTMYMPAAIDQLVENFKVPSLAQAMAGPGGQPSSTDLFGNLSSSIPTQPSLPLDQEPSPPKTYSFQERTLARRLHRACIEGAYHLLLDPSRRLHTYERVFKLSVLSRDRARMAASLKKILERGLDEPLDLWDAPLLHIGGAGTHYPRREEVQAMQPRKPVFHLGMIGPQMLNLLENVVQARPNVDISVEIAGFEGEWFDPYDIEGYLESKGIHIDPTLSFVEAEITDLPEISTSTSAGSSTRTSTGPGSRASTSHWDPDQWAELQGVEADLGRWHEVENVQVNGLGHVGFPDANTGSWMNLQPSPDQTAGKTTPLGIPYGHPDVSGLDANFKGYSGQGAAVPPEPAKKVVIIDVAKFVKVLTVTGVCLGRTPGFKRKDVDRALAISSFEAF